MKKLLSIAVLIAATALTACGGGGGSTGSPIPTPIHTNPPTTTYSVKVKFSGGDSLATVQSALRKGSAAVVYASPMDSSTSTQLPITMSIPAPDNSYFSNNPGQWQGVATVVVQPQPSTQPSAAFSVSGTSASVQPLPTTSAQPTAPPQAAVNASKSAVVGSGLLNVTLTGSVAQSSTVPIHMIDRSNVVCSDRAIPPQFGTTSLSSDQYGGVAFVNGTAQGVTSTSQADVYIDGSWCSGAGFVNTNDSNVTLYAPHGATLVSSVQTPFANVTAAQCANTFTSIAVSTLVSGIQDPVTPKDILLVNNAAGGCTKIALNATSAGTPPANGVNGSPAFLNFSYEVSGHSQDGF